MKYLLSFIIIFISNSALGVLDEVELDWNIYNDVEAKQYFIQLEVDRKTELIQSMQTVKLSLLTGEIKSAIKILNQNLLSYNRTPIEPTIKRYLALTHFVIGDYKSTLKYLKDTRFERIHYYKNICMLKVASLLHMGKSTQLDREMSLCQISNEGLSKNDFIWLSYMKDYVLDKGNTSQLKNKLMRKIQTSTRLEHSKSWLKFGLLLDYEDFISKNLGEIPEKAYKNKSIRALMGYTLYKNKEFEKSKDFIEDLTNSNSIYLKALLSIKDKKYKTAYAHNKAALQRRAFSINANQLMSSLAWINQSWKEGRYALAKTPPTKELRREQQLINVAYLVKEKNFYRARIELEQLFYEYNRKMPFEALIIESLVYLTLDDPKWQNSSANACTRFDGVNCWLHMQSKIWDNYANKIKSFQNKKEKVLVKLEGMIKEKKAPQIKEALFINQMDILELDIQEDPLLEDITIR